LRGKIHLFSFSEYFISRRGSSVIRIVCIGGVVIINAFGVWTGSILILTIVCTVCGIINGFGFIINGFVVIGINAFGIRMKHVIVHIIGGGTVNGIGVIISDFGFVINAFGVWTGSRPIRTVICIIQRRQVIIRAINGGGSFVWCSWVR
jgi:hypothetical protein